MSIQHILYIHTVLAQLTVSVLPKHIEDIHPSLWRASHLARQHGKVVPTGYERLNSELPGQGWPVAALIELLCQQAGIGELRLLAPALKAVSKRPIALINPTQVPHAQGFEYLAESHGRINLERIQ